MGRLLKDHHIIYAAVAVLAILAGAAFLQFGLTSLFFEFVMIWTVALLLLALVIWQERKWDVFPGMTKLLVSMVPLAFCLMAMWVILFSKESDHPLLLGTIFGLATVVGLAISIAVLVRVRERITSEMELLIEATKLMTDVRKRLIFVSLSLNIGYAAAISENKAYLIKNFQKAFRNALNHMTTSSDKEIELTVAYLNDEDMTKFLNFKAAGLSQFQFPVPHVHKQEYDPGDTVYLESSNALKEIASSLTAKAKVLRYAECLKSEGSKLLPDAGKFPPLGILIVDDTAILSYNISILDSAPVPLKGHITRQKEQVDALKVFSDIYLEKYAH